MEAVDRRPARGPVGWLSQKIIKGLRRDAFADLPMRDTFTRGQDALDVEHYDFKGGDRSGRQKHKRMGTMQTVRPSGKSSCLLPVLFNAIDSSTNFVYLSDSVHEELLDACSWVAPDN